MYQQRAVYLSIGENERRNVWEQEIKLHEASEPRDLGDNVSFRLEAALAVYSHSAQKEVYLQKRAHTATI
jgi:hypothetical protein